MNRKDLLFVLGICALVLLGEILVVVVLGQTRGPAVANNNVPMTSWKRTTVTKMAVPVQPMPAPNSIDTSQLMPLPGQNRNALITLPEASVIRQFGAPTSETQGAIGISNPSIVRQFPNAKTSTAQQFPNAKTLTFQIEGGVIYAVFEKTGKTWICVASEFIPDP